MLKPTLPTTGLLCNVTSPRSSRDFRRASRDIYNVVDELLVVIDPVPLEHQGELGVDPVRGVVRRTLKQVAAEWLARVLHSCGHAAGKGNLGCLNA